MRRAAGVFLGAAVKQRRVGEARAADGGLAAVERRAWRRPPLAVKRERGRASDRRIRGGMAVNAHAECVVQTNAGFLDDLGRHVRGVQPRNERRHALRQRCHICLPHVPDGEPRACITNPACWVLFSDVCYCSDRDRRAEWRRSREREPTEWAQIIACRHWYERLLMSARGSMASKRSFLTTDLLGYFRLRNSSSAYGLADGECVEREGLVRKATCQGHVLTDDWARDCRNSCAFRLHHGDAIIQARAEIGT